MKKEDLKAGYVVKLHNGEMGIIMPCEDELIINFLDYEDYGNKDVGNCSYVTIRDDFESESCDDYSIEKVYGFSKYEHKTLCLNVDEKYRELLWERKSVKNLTVSQIEGILGYKIKIISEVTK